MRTSRGGWLVAVWAALLKAGCATPPPPQPLDGITWADAGHNDIAPVLSAAMRKDPAARDGKGAYVAELGPATAVLTLDVELQDRLTSMLAQGRPQWGAAVVLDVETGRVLALAEAGQRNAVDRGAARQPLGKAASVFKVVTASALLRAGVSLDETVCTSGGKTRMHMSNLMDIPSRDHRCVRFEDVVPYSQNVAMAKLAGRYLTPELLVDEAKRFGFEGALATDIAVDPSHAEVPGDLFGFAQAAAGFGEVRLSALQGAVIAATVASGGKRPAPRIIESVNGVVVPELPAPAAVIDADKAAILQEMLTATVARGTAFRAFHATRDPYGKLAPLDVPVAGKTGSLTSREVDLDTTWFIGSAPAHAPKVAFAFVIINDEWIWNVRGLDVARRGVQIYFDLHPEDARAVAVARRDQKTGAQLQ